MDGDIQGLGASNTLALDAQNKLKAAEAAPDADRAQAAKRFEQLLATELVKDMRKSLDEGFFGSGAGSDVYEGWLDEHLASAITSGRGLGMRDAIAANLDAKGAAAKSADAKSTEESRPTAKRELSLKPDTDAKPHKFLPVKPAAKSDVKHYVHPPAGSAPKHPVKIEAKRAVNMHPDHFFKIAKKPGVAP